MADDDRMLCLRCYAEVSADAEECPACGCSFRGAGRFDRVIASDRPHTPAEPVSPWQSSARVMANAARAAARRYAA